MSRATRFCFNLNNYTPAQEDVLATLFERHPQKVVYILYGHETGDSGTPHLQGLLILKSRMRFNQVKDLLGFSLHLEVMKGTVQQASDYCKKDGDWVEFGECPAVTQGKRTDLDECVEWIKVFIGDNDRAPSAWDIAQVYPKLLMKFRHLPSVAKHMAPKIPSNFQTGEVRDWQIPLEEELDTPSDDDRKILFYVDPVGAAGKTWFTRNYLAKNDNVQILGTGSYTDLAYMIDENCRVFFFKVPRGGMEFLPYRLLESLKDRMVQFNKYQSRTKFLATIPHVIVMCNERPDMTKLSEDRYVIRMLSNEPPMVPNFNPEN
eukprot:g3616.t1 g3616   contig12:2426824-2427780(-)